MWFPVPVLPVTKCLDLQASSTSLSYYVKKQPLVSNLNFHISAAQLIDSVTGYSMIGIAVTLSAFLLYSHTSSCSLTYSSSIGSWSKICPCILNGSNYSKVLYCLLNFFIVFHKNTCYFPQFDKQMSVDQHQVAWHMHFQRRIDMNFFFWPQLTITSMWEVYFEQKPIKLFRFLFSPVKPCISYDNRFAFCSLLDKPRVVFKWQDIFTILLSAIHKSVLWFKFWDQGPGLETLWQFCHPHILKSWVSCLHLFYWQALLQCIVISGNKDNTARAIRKF